MRVLNNKIHFELLPPEYQPQKTIFNPTADMLKLAKVIDVGCKVEEVKKEDIITLYEMAIKSLGDGTGFCSERDVIFTNNIPQKNKVHIKNQEKLDMSMLNKATVVNSNCEDISQDDTVFYINGQSHILPDNTEIISESQIYYNKED